MAGDVASSPTSSSPAAQQAVLPFRVLVVDDNEDAADSLVVLLKMIGAQPAAAYDGVSALASIGVLNPNLVLLDFGMPGLDGFETARRIRALPEAANIALALTGWGQEGDRERTRKAGSERHLVKPVALGDLQELLSFLAASAKRP